MVPLSARRHRLDEKETPEVILGLKLRLEQLLMERSDMEKAVIAFHCLLRARRNFIYLITGIPKDKTTIYGIQMF